MKVMVVRLDAAKAHYASEMITDEVTKAKQVFGDNFPEDVSARGEFFLHLKPTFTAESTTASDKQ